MKLEQPKNANYAGTVVRLPKLLELAGSDFLKGAPLYGFQAIISIDHQEGELGIVFPAEVQLSEAFCYENGLHRHNELNRDPEAKGYLEDSRRVKALKLRGHRSDCLWLPIESLAYTGADVADFKEGDTFDTLKVDSHRTRLSAVEAIQRMRTICQCNAKIIQTDPLNLSHESFATAVTEVSCEPTIQSMTSGLKATRLGGGTPNEERNITRPITSSGTNDTRTIPSVRNDSGLVPNEAMSDDAGHQSSRNDSGLAICLGPTALPKTTTTECMKTKTDAVEFAESQERSTSTTIMSLAASADCSAPSVIEASESLETLKKAFSAHSTTCPVRQFLNVKRDGAILEVPAGVFTICTKYVVKTKPSSNQRPQEKKFSRVDPKLFPEHIDTENYWRNSHLIPQDQRIYVTQKIHGTSWRGSRSYVLRKLTLRDRLAKRLGVRVDSYEWDAIAGSRKVTKDPNNKDQAHFYGSDIWTDYLARVEHLIPEGYIVFGEIVGWTPDNAAIQSNYSYDMAPGTSELYIYRVAIVNARGVIVDLSWPQVRLWCAERELKHVPDLWEGTHSEFVAEDWIDKRFADEGFNALPLGSNKKLVDEGVCVRWDGLTPTILKAKSPIFLAHETKLLDKGDVNLEDEGSVQEEAA